MRRKRRRKPPALRLSREVRRLALMVRRKPRTFAAVFEALSLRSHALPALIFAAPFIPPWPLPGFSTIGGALLAIVGFRMAMGKGPWLPKSIRWRLVPVRMMSRILLIVGQVARLLELVVKPRGQWLRRHPGFNLVIGAMIGVCGLLIADPLLPPGTSTPPAATIVLLALGELEQDAVFIVAGYLAFLFNIIFFAALFWAQIKGMNAIFS